MAGHRVRRRRGRPTLYTALFMMFLAAGFIGAAALTVTALLGPKGRTSAMLNEAYESGNPASGDARERCLESCRKAGKL